MILRYHFVLISTFVLPALLACDAPSDAPETSQEAARASDDVVVRAGTGLVPLGVTADGHVIYQESQTVYAAALRAGAPPSRIDDVPAGNTAFAYISGNVAFVWTNPDYATPGFGVSPLTIWSAAHGARHASDSSPVGTLVTAANASGSRVVFPTASDAGGTQADLVLARADLGEQTTLVTAMRTSFPSGRCRPEATFIGGRAWEQVAAAYCTGDVSTATISIWWGEERRNFGGIATPPRFFVNPHFPLIATTSAPLPGQAFGEPTLISVLGRQAVDTVPSSLAFFGADGLLLYTDASAPPPARALRKTRFPGLMPAPLVTSSLRIVYGFGAGSSALHQPPTSADGRWLLYAGNVDPQTGLSDLVVADLRAAHSAERVLDAATTNTILPGNPFTSDSSFVVTNRVTDPSTGAGPLVATRLADLSQRTISDDLPVVFLPAIAGVVVVGDAASFAAASPFDFTVRLAAVDLSRPASEPRVLAAAARFNVYLTSSKRDVVYSTDEAGRAGIHVARLRG